MELLIDKLLKNVEILKNNKINCLGLLVSANKYFSSQNKGKSYSYYYGNPNNLSKGNGKVFNQILIEKDEEFLVKI